jgi:hypothetical protein
MKGSRLEDEVKFMRLLSCQLHLNSRDRDASVCPRSVTLTTECITASTGLEVRPICKSIHKKEQQNE